MRRLLPVLYLFVCSHSTSAQEKSTPAARPQNAQASNEARDYANPAAANVPIRRVVLYKNGVGYFEHLGHVRGSQGVHIDFTQRATKRRVEVIGRARSFWRAHHRSGIQLGSAAGTEVGNAAVVIGRA